MNFLIVDDDEVTCTGIKRRVLRLAAKEVGEVQCAYSGEEALAIVSQTPVDILITDIHMHKISGLDLVAQMKERNPRLSCIILTAFKDFDYAQRAIHMQVDDFLLKPCSERTMLDTVQKVIKRRKDMGWETTCPLEEYADQDPVEWACAYARKYVCQEVDMAVVANRLNLSYSYFSKLFRARIGKNFSEYVLEVKMKEAAYLLSSGMRAVDAAKRLGYANVQNFTRSFTKECGMTPGEYRAKARRGEA